MHNLAGRASVALGTFGGLLTIADPADLPEGGSPRCQDVDFNIGSVFTRDGLTSAYNYSGGSTGPNGGASATSAAPSITPWTNPSGILDDDGNYAVAALGTPSIFTGAPSDIIQGSTGDAWTNPANITSTSVYATNAVGSGSALLDCQSISASLPAGSIIDGISVSLQAEGSGFFLRFNLSVNDVAVGEKYSVAIDSDSPQPYTAGSPTFLWGLPSLSSADIASLGIQFEAVPTAFPSSSLSANSLSIKIYYTSGIVSDALQVTEFGFNIPDGSSINSIPLTVTGYSTDPANTLTAQLIQNGILIGSPQTLTLPSANAPITFPGGADAWGISLTAASVNNTTFGVSLMASSSASVYLDYASFTANTVAGQVNFNYLKSGLYQTGGEGDIQTLALDSAGTLWRDPNFSGQLEALIGDIVAGAYGKSASQFNREYLCFSDLKQGIDIPRQYAPQASNNGLDYWIDRVSQVGPGAPPVFSAALSAGTTANITAFSISSNIVTFTATNAFTAGEIVTISGLSVGTYLNGISFNVLGTGLSSSAFEVSFTYADVGLTSDTGLASPQYSYPIATITQPPIQVTEHPGTIDAILWSAGPGSTSSGTTITFYYLNAYQYNEPDQSLVDAFNNGQAVYVYIAGAPVGNGTQMVTSVGMGVPPGGEYGRWYFTIQVPTANYQSFGGHAFSGTYQQTIATLTTNTPIPGVSVGNQMVISGASVSNWDNTWIISQTLNSGNFNITLTSMASGVASYNWELVSGVGPQAGELVTITGTLNGNGVFNVTDAVIASASGTDAGTFTVSGFASQTIGSEAEQGQASTAGTQFQFDPGILTVGTNDNPIYGNSTGGQIATVGSTGQVVGAGTRQGVVIFQTRNGYQTAPSPPVTFTTPENSNYIYASNIPLGPPNTVARVIAFTEAGSNGVAGGYFYTIPNPVQFQVNGQTYTASSLTINDNVTTTAQFTFTDAVLLAASEIDIQGNDLFNLIELGNPAWVVPYASRMFYGLCQNKIQNFLNLSFDGGYLPSVGGNLSPLGWNSQLNPSGGTPGTITAFSIQNGIATFLAVNNYTVGQMVYISGLSIGTYLNNYTGPVLASGLTSAQFQVPVTFGNAYLTYDNGSVTPLDQGATLNVSPIFGNSYYAKNTTAETQAVFGLIWQSAYQDAYQVPILLPNTLYSVSVTARCPSAAQSGSLVVDLTDSSAGTGFGNTYGSFSISLSSMSTSMQTFTGTLLTSAFPTVPTDLALRVWGENIPYNGDFEIDRIRPYPTQTPVLTTQVIPSYVVNPESFDVDSIMNLNQNNSQPCYGAVVLYDLLYFLKSNSIYSTEDTPGSEPSQWTVHQVSNKAGTCGPNAYDYGQQWIVTACRNGVYVFTGNQPGKISQEIYQIWEAINWAAGNTIWVRNDVANRRLYVGVPLPTPNVWLPNAPVNANPSYPNVVLVCNYQGLGSGSELEEEAELHVTMFGTLAVQDAKRKWTIWNIASPYADFLTQSDGISEAINFGSGTESSQILKLDPNATSDAGNAINSLYTTYGFVDATGTSKNPLLGFHRKRFSVLQALLSGAGQAQIRLLPNTIQTNQPITIPIPITLADPAQNDVERPINAVGQRVFVEVSTNTVGQWFNLSSLILVGGADAWAPLRGVTGSNNG